MSDKTTDFGFTRIAEDEKARKVAEVFDSVASRYDLIEKAVPDPARRPTVLVG